MLADPKSLEFVKRVDEALDQLGERVSEDPSPTDFFDSALKMVNELLDCKASSVYEIGTDKQLRRFQTCGAKLPEYGPEELQDKIGKAIISQQAFQFHRKSKKREIFALIVPIASPQLALTVFFRQRPANQWVSVFNNVLAAVAEQIESYHARQVLRQRDLIHANYQKLVRFAEDIGKDLDLTKTAVSIANHTRGVLGCQRLSVLQRVNGRFRLVASSGASVVNRRSESSRALEELGNRCFGSGKPQTIHRLTEKERGAGNLGGQDLFAGKFCDVLDLQCCVLFPVHAYSVRAKFGLIAEFVEPGGDVAEGRLTALEPQISSALSNAYRYQSLPFLRSMEVLRTLRDSLGSTRGVFSSLLILLIVALILFSFFGLKTQRIVRARGVLSNEFDAFVYAPQDGHIEAVNAMFGQEVEAGDLLVQLASDEIQMELISIQGALEVAKKRVASEKTALSVSQSSSASSEEDNIRLNANLVASQEEVAFFENELTLIRERQKNLALLSPIEGKVVSWDLERELAIGRPVQRGQTLVHLQGETQTWQATVDVPYDQISLLIDDQFRPKAGIQVELNVAAAPETQYQGKVVEIANIASQNDSGNDSGVSSVRVMVEFPIGEQDTFLVAGASVIARFKCDRVSYADYYFGRAIQSARYWFY